MFKALKKKKKKGRERKKKKRKKLLCQNVLVQKSHICIFLSDTQRRYLALTKSLLAGSQFQGHGVKLASLFDFIFGAGLCFPLSLAQDRCTSQV